MAGEDRQERTSQADDVAEGTGSQGTGPGPGAAPSANVTGLRIQLLGHWDRAPHGTPCFRPWLVGSVDQNIMLMR